MNYDNGPGNAHDAVNQWQTPRDVWGVGGDLGGGLYDGDLRSRSSSSYSWWQTINRNDWVTCTNKLDMDRLSIAFHQDELPGL